MADPYIALFSEWKDVCNEFRCQPDTPDAVAVAAYDQEGYEGDALVVYRRGDRWFEQHGSHCSCYGLEDQWDFSEGEGLTQDQAIKHFTDCIGTTYSESRKEWLRVAIENIKNDDITVDPDALDVVPTIVKSMRLLAQRARALDADIAEAEKHLVELRASKTELVSQYRICEENVRKAIAGV